MERERVYVACDVSNLWHACRKEFGEAARLDFLALSRLVPSLRQPQQVTQQIVAYIVSHYKKNSEAFVNTLRGYGYRVRERHMMYAKMEQTRTKPTRTDWDVGITIDAIDHLSEYDRFVLMSGDGDFGQLIDYLRHRGKETTVLSFKDALSRGLYDHANEVVTLDKSVVFDRVWGPV